MVNMFPLVNGFNCCNFMSPNLPFPKHKEMLATTDIYVVFEQTHGSSAPTICKIFYCNKANLSMLNRFMDRKGRKTN